MTVFDRQHLQEGFAVEWVDQEMKYVAGFWWPCSQRRFIENGILSSDPES